MLYAIWRDSNCYGKDCPAVYVDGDPVRTIVQGKVTGSPATVRIPASSAAPVDLLASIGASTTSDGDHLVVGIPADQATLDRLDGLGADETAVIVR